MPQEVIDASQHLGRKEFKSRAEDNISQSAYAWGYYEGKEFDPARRLQEA